MALRPSRAAGFIAGCAVFTAIASTSAAVAQPPSASGDDRVTVDGSTPSWATPAAKLAAAPDGQQRHVQIALALKDKRGAEQLAKAVSTPGSPSYHRYLSGAEFTDRFAASKETAERVSTWLKSTGLQVTGVSANRHFVEAVGSVKQLEGAFGVSLATYRHDRNGKVQTLTAPEAPMSLPRSVRGAVTAVVGLDDSAKAVTAQVSRPAESARTTPAAAGTPTSCAKYWAESNNSGVPQKYGAGMQSNAVCGYTAPQMRSMYALDSNATGAGTTVAIVGAYNSTTIEADANKAATQFGGVPLAAGQYSTVLPSRFENQDRCAPDSWASEQALDVQSVHELAPKAKIRYYGASDCFTLFTALNKAVEENTASVISNSWLVPSESSVAATDREQMDAIGIQAAIQGQALIVCSGDSGDNSALNKRPEPSFPSSHPWITAVGGTTVGLDGNGSPRFTTGWENSGNTLTSGTWRPQTDADGRFAGGGGGGISTLFDAPEYQADAVPASVANGHRTVPDIAALGDSYTGIAIGLTTKQGYVTYASGGTSLAAPLIAALVADAQQVQGVERFGFLNGALYGMKQGLVDVQPVKAGIWAPQMAGFGGVTVPTAPGSYLLDVDSKPQTLQSGKGWDVVTGVGTPGPGFITALGK